MKRAIVILTILVLLVTSVSCMPTKTGPTQKDLDQDATISTKVSKGTFDALKETVNTVKTEAETVKTDVEALKTKVNQPSAATDVYTKTQVDAAIAQAVTNAVNNLKNDQTWIKVKTTTTSSSSSSSSDDDVLDEDGDLVLTLDRTIEDEIPMADGSYSEYFRLTVTNNGGSTYFRVNAEFDANQEVVFATYPILTFSCDGNSGAYMFCNTANLRTDNLVAHANVWSSGNNISNLSFTSRNSSGTNKLWIGKGKAVSMFFRLYTDYVTTSDVREWEWSFSLKEIDN